MIGFCATFVLLVVAGCGTKSLTPPDNGPGDNHPVGDASGCMCQAEADPTLTMSWDCFCRLNNCNAVEKIGNCAVTPGVWTRGCGFDEYSIETVGGLEVWVYDSTGRQVGGQIATDEGMYVCPDDKTLMGSVIWAGQFRPATCESVVTCNCADTDAGTGASCVTGDGGLTTR